MKQLLALLGVVVLVAAAMIFTPHILDDLGYVLIVYGTQAIEMTIVSVIVITTFSLIVLWVIVRVIGWALRFFKGSGGLLAHFGERKREKAFFDGLQALAAGDQQAASKALAKTQSGEFHGVNYLAAAQSTTNEKLANDYLLQASEHPESKVAATLMRARNHQQRSEFKLALTVLDELIAPQDNQVEVVRLKAKLLAQDNQWQVLKERLPKWKKVLPKADYANWSEQISKGKFAEIASKQGAADLKQYWQDLPRKQRNDNTLRAAYVQQLLDQGMHADAQTLLVEWQQKGPNERLFPLFSKLNVANAASAISALESWIKNDAENPSLYSTLGNVAFNMGDSVLAEKALLKAVKLQPNSDDLKTLSAIYERNQEPVKALHYYKQAYQI